MRLCILHSSPTVRFDDARRPPRMRGLAPPDAEGGRTMRNGPARPARLALALALPCAAALVLSCSPSEMVRRSDEAYAAGHADKAFDWAKRALDKQPSNPNARAAATRAGGAIVEERKQRIRGLAEVDTIAAARQCLELGDFRAQLARYQIELPRDSAFAAMEAGLRTGAAGIFYNMGLASSAAQRPKKAYGEFSEARHFAAGYLDAGERAGRAYNAALTRVAVLSFENQTDVPGLASQLRASTQQALAHELARGRFKFTQVVGSDQVDQKMTVAQAGHLSREQAIELGRQLGAQRVVVGRVYGLGSNTDTDTYHGNVYRKVTDKDENGKTRVRYVEQGFDAVRRVRHVKVSCEIEVLDTDEEATLARTGEERNAVARTAYTHFEPTGNCDDYCLVPPDARAADPDRAKRLQEEWGEKFGSWTVPKLLERARKDSGRTRYQHQYRSEFASDAGHPVFLDDVPPVEELAAIALDGMWRSVVDALIRLDGTDAVDVKGVGGE
jgi:tetratricopeptide (TPR) repeat protein